MDLIQRSFTLAGSLRTMALRQRSRDRIAELSDAGETPRVAYRSPGARQPLRIKARECFIERMAREEARQYRGIFQSLACSLPEIWRNGVRRVAEQSQAAPRLGMQWQNIEDIGPYHISAG